MMADGLRVSSEAQHQWVLDLKKADLAIHNEKHDLAENLLDELKDFRRYFGKDDADKKRDYPFLIYACNEIAQRELLLAARIGDAGTRFIESARTVLRRGSSLYQDVKEDVPAELGFEFCRNVGIFILDNPFNVHEFGIAEHCFESAMRHHLPNEIHSPLERAELISLQALALAMQRKPDDKEKVLLLVESALDLADKHKMAPDEDTVLSEYDLFLFSLYPEIRNNIGMALLAVGDPIGAMECHAIANSWLSDYVEGTLLAEAEPPNYVVDALVLQCRNLLNLANAESSSTIKEHLNPGISAGSMPRTSARSHLRDAGFIMEAIQQITGRAAYELERAHSIVNLRRRLAEMFRSRLDQDARQKKAVTISNDCYGLLLNHAHFFESRKDMAAQVYELAAMAHQAVGTNQNHAIAEGFWYDTKEAATIFYGEDHPEVVRIERMSREAGRNEGPRRMAAPSL